MATPNPPMGKCATLVLTESLGKNLEAFRDMLEQAIARGSRTLVLRPMETLSKGEISQLREVLDRFYEQDETKQQGTRLCCMIEDDVLLAKRLMAHGILFTKEPQGCTYRRVREVLGSKPLIGLSINSSNEAPQDPDDGEIDFYYLRDSGELQMKTVLRIH